MKSIAAVVCKLRRYFKKWTLRKIIKILNFYLLPNCFFIGEDGLALDEKTFALSLKSIAPGVRKLRCNFQSGHRIFFLNYEFFFCSKLFLYWLKWFIIVSNVVCAKRGGCWKDVCAQKKGLEFTIAVNLINYS